MRRIISNTIELTVDIESVLNENLEKMVFYYANDKDYPVFLKFIGGYWGFLNPFVSGSSSLSFPSVIMSESIKKASKERKVYFLLKSEWGELFNTVRK